MDMSLEAQEFKQVVDEIIPLIGAANVWDYLPVMRWLDVSGVRSRILATVSRRDAFLHRLIDAERRRMDEGGAGDEGEKKSMIAVLLTLQKTEPELYTDQMIIALCAVSHFSTWLLLTYPSTSTVSFFIKDIGNLASSVDSGHQIATTRPDADDVPRLSYLQCIINETLRLYPAAPPLLPHESSADCKVGGYDVRSGTMLIVNAYALHMDPAVWEDPTAFRPERFEDGKGDGLLLMPFGMGRRRCPGEALALQTVGVVLGTLVQCFDWDRVDGVEVDMTEGVGITMPKAVALEAVCRPRAAMRDVLQKL
ncbi:cytochrome P450 81Q32-like [Triticum aestivum]|nr:cytochrome P450 81Q32-like [Triticum aestivum]